MVSDPPRPNSPEFANADTDQIPMYPTKTKSEDSDAASDGSREMRKSSEGFVGCRLRMHGGTRLLFQQQAVTIELLGFSQLMSSRNRRKNLQTKE